MVAVKISAFGGMLPAQEDTLLPQNNSATNENVFLDSGALQGMREPVSIHTMSNPASKFAFRIPLALNNRDYLSASAWWESTDAKTDVLRSPVANDQYDRFYMANTIAAPRYNTRARLVAGSASYILGIPAPSSAPTCVVTLGSAATETRAYVTTWVSTYGEEGPPSPALLKTDFSNGTWTLTIPAPSGGDTTDRSLAYTRIYRTITSVTGTAVYYLVAQIAIGTLSYADTVSNVTLAGNTILQSTYWSAPPTDMKGFVSMPNGIFAGWRGNEIWFCEPYRPHAWPTPYTLSVDAQIIGLGVVGQTLVVLTEAFPYGVTGVHPSNMASSKIATFEPCMSRRSIVSTAQGVFYASPNGIVLAAYGVVQNVTLQLATKDRWLDLVRPETLCAARLGASYYGWGTTLAGAYSFETTAFQTTAFQQEDVSGAMEGILINPTDPRISWANLVTDTVNDNVITDLWSGEIFLVRGGQVLWFDPSSTAIQGPYMWRSKVFQLAEFRNLSVMRVWFDNTTNDPSFTLNPVRNTSTPQTLQANQYGLVRVYANDILVMTRELRTSGELMRLPSGFKTVRWQFEIEARVKVYNFEVASSVKELKGV